MERTPPDHACAQEHFARAMDMEVAQDDRVGLRERAAELSLAIATSENHFPAAQAQLGLTLWMLGEERRARHECERALRDDPENVAALAFLTLMALDRSGDPHLPPTGSGWGDLFLLGIGWSVAAGKLAALSRQVSTLARAFPQDVSRSADAEYWLQMGELLLIVHDALQDVPRLGGKDRLARAVLAAPWDRLAVPAYLRPRVEDLLRRARGRCALLKVP